MLEGCVSAVHKAFVGTDRLFAVKAQKERRLVKVDFRDGVPVATQAAAEAHSFLLRELINIGALDTKATKHIRHGFMELDKARGYELSHRKSSHGRKRWAADEAEAARLLLTYVKKCNHRGPGKSPSKILRKLKLLIEARPKSPSPKPKTKPKSASPPESDSSDDESTSVASTASSSIQIIEASPPLPDPPHSAPEIIKEKEKDAPGGKYIPPRGGRKLTKVISLDDESPEHYAQRCPDFPSGQHQDVNVTLDNVFNAAEHREVMKRPAASMKRPAAAMQQQAAKKQKVACSKAPREVQDILEQLKSLNDVACLPCGDVSPGGNYTVKVNGLNITVRLKNKAFYVKPVPRISKFRNVRTDKFHGSYISFKPCLKTAWKQVLHIAQFTV